MTPAGRSCLAVVLAAGEGTRMRSGRPKVLHEIGGRPMLSHVLAAVGAAGIDAVAVVIGPGREDVADAVARQAVGAQIFVQTERRGTAHAVLAARQALSEGFDDVLVLYADVPLIQPATLRDLRDAVASGATVAVLGFEAADPTGYGRLLQENGDLIAIREQRDANQTERAIKLCNSGLMVLDGRRVLDLLNRIGSNNAQGEYYLTDIVELVRRDGGRTAVVTVEETEVLGVNDRVQLAEAERRLQNRLREAAMRGGVTLQAPDTVFLAADTRFGRDVVVEPHVVFGPGVTVEDEVVIHAFSHLEGAHVRRGATVGPYARLRPGARLAEGAKIGNFVEIKNADIGPGAKVSHLSYIGDASVGASANIGAGTITCNYDGFGKAHTEIGEGAFIGSNSALVAPVTIGRGSFVGSGSVITDAVPEDALALARGRQVNKDGWAAAFRADRQKAKTKKPA